MTAEAIQRNTWPSLTPSEPATEHPDMAKRRGDPAIGPRERELQGIMSVRVSEADIARLTALSDQMPFPATTIARIAMRLGLDALEQDPALALSVPVERRGGARKRKT